LLNSNEGERNRAGRLSVLLLRGKRIENLNSKKRGKCFGGLSMINIKKSVVIFLILAVIIAMLIPVLADDEGDPEIIETTLNNAGFHCGAAQGNGRVRPDGYSNGQQVSFERIDETTWKLVGDDYICPKCGRTEWVSYSNKSGTPDGKNIQLTHISESPVTFVPLNLLVTKESSHELSDDFCIKVYEANGNAKGGLVARLKVDGSGVNWYYFEGEDPNVHCWVVINLYEGSYILEESGHKFSAAGYPLKQGSVEEYSVTILHDSSEPSTLPQPFGGVSEYHETAQLKNIYREDEESTTTGKITVTVEKKLKGDIVDTDTEFTFSLDMWVNGTPYAGVDPDEQAIKADGTATWGPYTFNAGAVVEYEVTEKNTPGYKVDSSVIKIGEETPEKNLITIVAGDDIKIEYTVTNTLDGSPPPQEDGDLLELKVYKSFRLGGVASRIPDQAVFSFELADDEGNIAARGGYTTNGNEEAGDQKNYAVSLVATSGYEFDSEQTYTLREVTGTSTGWTYDKNTYKVGYIEYTVDNELYGELYHIVDNGAPENNNECGNLSNYIEVDEVIYPVFVNRYSRSGTVASTTKSDQKKETVTEVPDITPPLDDKPVIPVEIIEEIPEVIQRGAPDEPVEFVVPVMLTPLSIMPQTNVADNMIKVWMYGLCCSVLGLGILLLIIKRASKKAD